MKADDFYSLLAMEIETAAVELVVKDLKKEAKKEYFPSYDEKVDWGTFTCVLFTPRPKNQRAK